jgi:hypothetical protein
MVKLQHLNGWRRLWLIAAGAWLLVVSVHLINTFPSVEQYRTTWRRFAEAEAPSMQAKQSPELWACEERARKLAEPYGPLLECHAAATNPTAEDRERYARTIAKGDAQIAGELAGNQARHIAGGFAAWLVPVLLLYGAGWLVGWVRRGFAEQA